MRQLVGGVRHGFHRAVSRRILRRCTSDWRAVRGIPLRSSVGVFSSINVRVMPQPCLRAVYSFRPPTFPLRGILFGALFLRKMAFRGGTEAEAICGMPHESGLRSSSAPQSEGSDEAAVGRMSRGGIPYRKIWSESRRSPIRPYLRSAVIRIGRCSDLSEPIGVNVYPDPKSALKSFGVHYDLFSGKKYGTNSACANPFRRSSGPDGGGWSFRRGAGTRRRA